MSTHDARTNRDEELGAALRELEVPEHDPGFYRRLEHRLAEAASDRNRGSRRRRRLGVAAVAAAAAALLFFVGLPRDEGVPDIVQRQVATAAEIQAKVRAALAQAESLSGILVADGREKGDEQRWRFALTDEGDFRMTGITLVSDVAYDASSGVERSLNTSASIGGDTVFAAERTGVAPGRPDSGPSSSWILPREFGAVVRALLAAEDPRVREITYEERAAWRLDIAAVPNAIVSAFSGDRFEITVDRETGIPVRVVESKNGAFLRELRIEKLAVDAPLPSGTFSLKFEPDAEIMRSDDGFRRVELAQVEAAVGYAPLVPAWIPEGYELAEVAVARQAPSTGVEAGNPASRMIVSLSYRRGFDQFLVTTRLAGPEPWSDPLATGEGFVDEPERIVLRRGALAGATGELVIVPRGLPHLWTVGENLVLTVGGDLDRDELLRVTESLRRAR